MAGRRRRSLVVSVTDARGRAVASADLARWLPRAAPARARGVVTIGLVSDATIRRLNRRFRRKDYATDVLSFPGGGPAVRGLGPALGDIAIATGVARRQAREHGHAVALEMRLLALHGLLHLLGYDHDVDRGEMRRVEDRLRRRSGLPRGLVARASARAARR
jgi:probable rRNA maturation factor